MSEDEIASVNLVSSSEKKRKNPALGRGKPVPETSTLIPFETPGRGMAIRSRSPFREAPSVPVQEVQDDIRPIDQIHSVPLSVARSSPGSTKSSQSRMERTERIERTERESMRSSLHGRGVRDHDHGRQSPDSIVNSGYHLGEAPVNPVNPVNPMYSSQHVGHSSTPHSSQPVALPPGYPYPYQPIPQGYYPQYNPNNNNLPPPMPDYDHMSHEEQEDARIIFRSKFTKLKEKYPERCFDDYDPELPLRHIHRIYEDHLNTISAESNFSMSRIFLAVVFFCIEGFFTKFIGVDISGFAKDQLKQFKRYESLLMELGEKYTSGFGSNWPIEFRILFLIGFNTLSIAGIKFLCSKAGYSSDYATKVFNSLIGSVVDDFVETKEAPAVDPVTKTVDPDTEDVTGNLMGRAQELANMASNLFGGPNSKDPTDAISHWGSKALNSISSGKDAKDSGKRDVKNIRYGRNKRK